MRLDTLVHENICERGEFIDDAASISVDLLICTLIFENQGLLQTLEKFQVLQTWILF